MSAASLSSAPLSSTIVLSSNKDKDYREKEDKELGDESRETKPYSQVNNTLKDPAVDEPEMLLGNDLDLSLKLKKTEHRTK